MKKKWPPLFYGIFILYYNVVKMKTVYFVTIFIKAADFNKIYHDWHYEHSLFKVEKIVIINCFVFVMNTGFPNFIFAHILFFSKNLWSVNLSNLFNE